LSKRIESKCSVGSAIFRLKKRSDLEANVKNAALICMFAKIAEITRQENRTIV
jgi:hypothetical protein